MRFARYSKLLPGYQKRHRGVAARLSCISLTALTRLYPQHVRKIGKHPAEVRTLGALVELASETGWLSGNALRAARCIVKSRNKVHADRLARRGQLPRIRVGEFEGRSDDMGEVNDALYKVVESNLRRAMIREGLL